MITKDLNILTHQIKNNFGLSWAESFRLAIRAMRSLTSQEIMSPTGVFGEWSYVSLKAVAGHFWGLGKAYDNLTNGRSHLMLRISKGLYAVLEEEGRFSFGEFSQRRYVGATIRAEIVDFFIGSKFGSPTPRSLDLTQRSKHYSEKLILPTWRF